jgi:hypothetical protein
MSLLISNIDYFIHEVGQMLETQDVSYFKFIPQSADSLLQEPSFRYLHLHLFIFIMKNSIAALEKMFIHKSYENFDPHVGDTLCQIRGAIFSYYSSNPPILVEQEIKRLGDVVRQAENTLPRIKEITHTKRSKQDRARQDYQTLAGFSSEINLSISVSNFIHMLTMAFLLAKYKVHPLGILPRVDIKLLQSDLSISKEMANKLVQYWQKDLTRYSSDFIQNQATLYSPLVPILRKSDEANRDVLPSYFVMKHIFNFLLENKISLYLTVRYPDVARKPLLRIPFIATGSDFVIGTNEDRSSPHFIVQCVSKMIDSEDDESYRILYNKIKQEGIQNILLASVANHPQYCGKKLSILGENVYQSLSEEISSNPLALFLLKTLSNEYSSYLNYAKKNRCDFLKPDFIFVEHMFVGSPQNQEQIYGIYFPVELDQSF